MASSRSCPICQKHLDGFSEHDADLHINNCLDHNLSNEHPITMARVIQNDEPAQTIEPPPYQGERISDYEMQQAIDPQRINSIEKGMSDQKVLEREHVRPEIEGEASATAHQLSALDFRGDPQAHPVKNYLGDDIGPPLPPRPSDAGSGLDQPHLAYSDNIGDPTNYRRDPHKLIAYLIPFPKPDLKSKGLEGRQIPARFLIYTPPPPPLKAPKEGEKEARSHKLQRKWENEVRQAKQSKDKLASWKGVKSRATKGIDWAMGQVKSADLEFMNRIPGSAKKSADQADHKPDDHKTVGLEEMVLVYPASFDATPEQVREEFINSMMRTKSKAHRDSVIATGLLPISAGIDLLATPIWPFGGLLEVDGVWAYASIRGAKTARGVTKRLQSSGTAEGSEEAQLKLTFVQSPKLEVLKAYLGTKCHERDARMFRLDTSTRIRPTETDVLEAIAWTPAETAGAKNWEDEQWELEEVKEDLRTTIGKGAKAWDKWVKGFEKDPERALKK